MLDLDMHFIRAVLAKTVERAVLDSDKPAYAEEVRGFAASEHAAWMLDALRMGHVNVLEGNVRVAKYGGHRLICRRRARR